MVEYRLIRSKRKTVAIQVTEDCEIIVRAPKKYPIEKIEEFIDEKSDWVQKAMERQKHRREGKLELTETDIKALKKIAKENLPPRVEHYEKLMGVKCEGIKITSAKKRFGSCNSKNMLCFSYILMLCPQEAIDYVIVHELAHTVYHNHSRDFYNFVAKVMPDYKRRDKLLYSPQSLSQYNI